MYHVFDVKKELGNDLNKNGFPKNKAFHRPIYERLINEITRFKEEKGIDNSELIIDFSQCENVKSDVEGLRTAAIMFCGASWVFSEYSVDMESIKGAIQLSIMMNTVETVEGMFRIYFVPGVVPEAERTKTERDRDVVDRLLSEAIVDEDDGILSLEYYKYDTALYNVSRSSMLLDGLVNKALENSLSDVHLYIGDITIQKEAAFHILAKLRDAKKESGVDISIFLKDEETFDILNSLALSNKRLPVGYRDKIFKSFEKRAGLLYVYKAERRGSNGEKSVHGQIQYSSFALIDSVDLKKKKVRVLMFEPRTFTTRLTNMVENNDGGMHIPDGIQSVYDEVFEHPQGDTYIFGKYREFSFEALGITDEFLGSKAHFDDIIQYDHTEMRSLYINGEDGDIYSDKFTLAEYMDRVLNDYNIEYDTVELEKSIMRTRNILLNSDEEYFHFQLK